MTPLFFSIETDRGWIYIKWQYKMVILHIIMVMNTNFHCWYLHGLVQHRVSKHSENNLWEKNSQNIYYKDFWDYLGQQSITQAIQPFRNITIPRN
jgi:hypothetical protein